MTSMTMGTIDHNEMAPEAPKPTHINVHIHQESAIAKLLLTGCSKLRLPASASGTAALNSRLLVATWVVQIVLGVLSGVLGGFLYIYWYSEMCFTGTPIWTGVVALLAGITAFMYEKRGGICWALLRTLFALAAFCTAIAAIIIGARSFNDYRYYFRDDLCQVSSSSSRRGWATEAPSSPSPEDLERFHLCLSYMNMTKALIVSLQAMLLTVWILLLLASLTPLFRYCWKKFFTTENAADEKKLLEAGRI